MLGRAGAGCTGERARPGGWLGVKSRGPIEPDGDRNFLGGRGRATTACWDLFNGRSASSTVVERVAVGGSNPREDGIGVEVGRGKRMAAKREQRRNGL